MTRVACGLYERCVVVRQPLQFVDELWACDDDKPSVYKRNLEHASFILWIHIYEVLYESVTSAQTLS